jgi:tetratricopeptide (TPR) repeat protein
MRLTRPLAILLFIVALSPRFALALTPEEVSGLRARALEHFYSLEYGQAIPLFEQLRDAEPQSAAWQNHVAMAYFYELLHSAGALQGDLFGASNRFFRTRRITPDPQLAQRFHQANEAAIRLCEQRLKQVKNEESALYSCGVAYAARATYLGLVERKLFDSLGSARRANDFHSRLIRIHPKFYDAYLVPGLYDFLLGSLPKAAKFFLFFGGMTGNKARGIEKVETVVQSGDGARQDARILLTVMYRRERRFADARKTMQTLAEAFPRNYIFPLEIASLHRGEDEKEQAIQRYEQVLERISDAAPGFDRAPAARIHFELGDLYKQTGNTEAALEHLRLVSTSRGTSPDLDREAAVIIQQLTQPHQPAAL